MNQSMLTGGMVSKNVGIQPVPVQPDTLGNVLNQTLANLETLERQLSEISDRLTGPKPECVNKDAVPTPGGQLGLATELRTRTARLNTLAGYILNEL